MSAQVESPVMDVPVPQGRAVRWWSVVERALSWTGDRLNPILVKETRQALKSRQFIITFGLLLICGWVWSILRVAWIGPGIYYSEHGPDMFLGYYLILALPLFVIVPYGAFRSLAGEQEDRTYELLSITSLGPRQIVRGKLGSAGLQMLIYLSAISPCLAFTYMLRGIDFLTILFILGYTILSSLGLAVIGLLIGTLTSERHWQVVLSVLFIAGLLFGGWMGFMATVGILMWGELTFNEPEFWVVCAACVTFYLTYFMLLFYAAAAQITFASDNRSTRLRITMLAQHVLFVGWMAWLWVGPAQGEDELPYVFMILIGLHWYAMGAFMTGESPELSPRVRRALPQSFLGRVFLTWFNPGPGTGYLFTVCNLLAALAMVYVGVMVADGRAWQRWGSGYSEQALAFGLLGVSYITIYLGLGLLLARLLRRFTQVGILLSALVQVLLVLLGTLAPWVVQLMTMYGEEYTYLLIASPGHTLAYIGDRSSLPPEAPVLLTVVPAVALIVFVLNLRGVAREVRHVRIAKPWRVAEEDAALAALKPPPPEAKRISPWD